MRVGYGRPVFGGPSPRGPAAADACSHPPRPPPAQPDCTANGRRTEEVLPVPPSTSAAQYYQQPVFVGAPRGAAAARRSTPLTDMCRIPGMPQSGREPY